MRLHKPLFALCGLLLSIGVTVKAQVTLPKGTVITASNTTYDNMDIIVDGTVTGTATIDGQHSFKSLTLQNNGVVTHDAQSSPNFAGGMNLVISGNCTIEVGSAINANGQGWAGGSGSMPALGPGAGSDDTTGSGGGNGGAYGGEALSALGSAFYGGIYGDLTLKAPTDIGSGGGSGDGGAEAGGNGGGAIQMTVGGVLLVNGQLSADGASAGGPGGHWLGGAGSGGSIILNVGTLSGSGFISASGGSLIYPGSNNNGSGSGGRIAIYYTTNTLAAPLTISGYQIRAAGGKSANGYYAGAGTVFLQQVGQTQGDLWIHNQGNAATTGASTPLHDGLTFDDIYVWGQGVLASTPGNPLRLTVLRNVTVAADGQISVTGRGYSGGEGAIPAFGPGAGVNDVSGLGGSGGSYGGEALDGSAAVITGAVYDELALKAPTDLGSGGGSGSLGIDPGGNGGGAFQLTVVGTLQIDGSLTADGQNSYDHGAGGSGGSITLDVGVLTGVGFISASGGGTYTGGLFIGGSGGGGRVAIYYTINNLAVPLTTSGYQIRAAGGYSQWIQHYAGAGTVFLQQAGQTQGDLWIHNMGNAENAGAYTSLMDPPVFDDVYIWGNGVLAPPPGLPLTLQALGTLDVGVNGALSAVGRGYAGGIANRPAGGPGAGMSGLTTNASGGGGGYGGAGDANNSGAVRGGGIYGSATMPTDLGSGGGSGFQGAEYGGAGGGAIHTIVNGTLQVDGSILADGTDVNNLGGGGSGGSLWLVTNTLSGAGLISASGASTHYYAGSGGGGRIAIYAFANSFASGTIQASGGADYQSGGSVGTVKTFATSGASVHSLKLAASAVAEGQNIGGAVTLSGPAPTGGVTIVLTNANPSVAFVPPSVTVAAGQKSAAFNISAYPAAQNAATTISAQLGGTTQATTLNVVPWIKAITLSPSAVVAGTGSTGTVSLNFPAPQGGLPITLQSGNASAVSVATSVVVPKGKTSATFSIDTRNSVTSETAVLISATYGSEAAATTLYVDPVGEALKAFVLAPATLVGGNTSVGSVSLNANAPTGGVVVALSSADANLISIPAIVIIAAGQSNATFTISTPQVVKSLSIKLSATLGAVTKLCTIQITPTGVGMMMLSPSSVQGGGTSVGTVTLQNAVTTSTTVTITSSNPAAIPDKSIVIAAGSVSGTFNIATTANKTGKPIKAVVTATADNVSQKATLTID